MFKRIVAWIVISLIFQFGILMFLDKFFFTGFSGAYSNTDNTKSAVTVPVAPAEFEIPASARDIKVSYDGTHAAYINGGELVVVDVRKKKEVNRLSKDGYGISFYKWLSDRNRAVIIYKGSQLGGITFSIHSYDADSSKENEYEDISDMPENSEIADIQLSPLTNIIYFNIRINEKNTRLYRMNIMEHIKRVYPKVTNIKRMFECNLKDLLLYEDSARNIVYVQDGSESWSIPIRKKLALLGVDGEDRVYLGEMENGEIKAVYKGKLSLEPKYWEKIPLKDARKVDDFLLTPGGEVFFKSGEGSITRLSDGSNIKYKGEFVEVLNNYIVSLYNDNIELTVH